MSNMAASVCSDRFERLRSIPLWSDGAVAEARLPVRTVPLVAIGGGLASFALVDLLRMCGASTHDITVVSPQQLPYETFRHLARNSQIRDGDPLRSDSMSRADNVWGFPSYALEEAIRNRSLRPLWNVLTEPVLTEFYNPAPDRVYRGLDREAARIGWKIMLTPGRVELVRRRRGGGYFSLVYPLNGTSPFALHSRYVHLATGYPALRYLPTFRKYRMHNGDYHVVNAYEPHEHVYEALKRRAGTVVVRGSGIVASRVLQRLIEDRALSRQAVHIVHLFRSGADSRGRSGDGWQYQPFSFPKAASGGQYRQRMLRLSSSERAELITSTGGTTTASRRLWRRQLRHARRNGFYQPLLGETLSMEHRGGKVLLTIGRSGPPQYDVVEADYVIDCTGLEPDIRQSPLLSDLLKNVGAAMNPLCGLDVSHSFEVRGTRNEPGRLYASGVITLGGYLAPVDSFLGFAHAALLICDDLADLGFCRRMNMRRSVKNWINWLANEVP